MLNLAQVRRDEDVLRLRPGRSPKLVGTIVKIRSLTKLERLYTIRVERDGVPICFGACPGQFGNFLVDGVGKVPISVTSMPSDHDGRYVDFAIRNASGGEDGTALLGGVTHAIHQMRVGDTVGIEGPIGVGYPMEALKGRDILMAMTGIGYFPVRSAMRHILAHRADYGRIYIFFGVKYSSEIYFPEEVAAFERDPSIHFGLAVSREKSWSGFQGHVTTLIEKLELNEARTSALFCGPTRMFKDLGALLTRKGVDPGRVSMSLEDPMYCAGDTERGFCGRCGNNGTLICRDGPVFQLDDIRRRRLWEIRNA